MNQHSILVFTNATKVFITDECSRKRKINNSYFLKIKMLCLWLGLILTIIFIGSELSAGELLLRGGKLYILIEIDQYYTELLLRGGKLSKVLKWDSEIDELLLRGGKTCSSGFEPDRNES